MKLPKKLGFWVLSVWLILIGIMFLFSIGSVFLNVVLGILGIAAGVLILLGRDD